MSEPDPGIQAEMASPKASAVQNGGGGSMSLDQQVIKGFDGATKGFDQKILNHGDKNLVDELGQSPLTAAAGGKINAFEGLQTADVSAKVSGNAMTPPSLNQSNALGMGGQGQER